MALLPYARVAQQARGAPRDQAPCHHLSKDAVKPPCTSASCLLNGDHLYTGRL